MKYSLKCSCGDIMTVDASSLDEAKQKFKDMLTPEMVAQHMAEKHPGEAVMPQDQVQMMVDQNTVEGDLNEHSEGGMGGGMSDQGATPMGGASDTSPTSDAGMHPDDQNQGGSGNNSGQM